jgi:hypothetical protein
MTESVIERMALEACDGHDFRDRDGDWILDQGELARFAGLVRAQALEDAARLCESREQAWLAEADRHAADGNLKLRDLLARQAYGNGESAAAIRAIAGDAK